MIADLRVYIFQYNSSLFQIIINFGGEYEEYNIKDMKNKQKFNTIYKIRFLPLAITAILLIMVTLLKHVHHVEVGKFFEWSIFLALAGFIYCRGVLEKKNEIEKEEE